MAGFAFLKSESFAIISSVILGIGIVVIFKPMCKSSECIIQKAPSIDEITKTTYDIKGKCYQFHTKSVDCPTNGVIEPFQVRAERA